MRAPTRARRWVEGETLLMTAARTGNVKVVRALIAHGADLEARESYYGETALIWAVAENHAENGGGAPERWRRSECALQPGGGSPATDSGCRCFRKAIGLR